MRKVLLAMSTAGLFFVFSACSKNDDNKTSNARTMANLGGSYGLTAASANVGGFTLNLYDSLDACDRDNIIQLDTNGIAKFIDAGVVCVPPSDSTGSWSLSSNTDTIYIGNTSNFIKSWDGKTLITTTTQQISGFPISATVTTTLVKK